MSYLVAVIVIVVSLLGLITIVRTVRVVNQGSWGWSSGSASFRPCGSRA